MVEPRHDQVWTDLAHEPHQLDEGAGQAGKPVEPQTMDLDTRLSQTACMGTAIEQRYNDVVHGTALLRSDHQADEHRFSSAPVQVGYDMKDGTALLRRTGRRFRGPVILLASRKQPTAPNEQVFKPRVLLP